MAVVIAELALLALTVRATLKSSKRSDANDECVIGLWIITAILLSPTVWLHYMVLLLITFAALVRQYLFGRASLRAARLGIASYLIAELLMAVYLAFGQLTDWTQQLPYWTRAPSMIGWPLSLLLAYAAAYFLAVDSTSTVAATNRALRRRPRRREAV